MNERAENLLLAWAVGVFIILIGIYVLTMPQSITLEDAGLFQMVCHKGGIGHPPGYPLFILGCQAFVSIPMFDDSVLAANLLSAIYAALSCSLLVYIAFEILKDKAAAILVALCYGLSLTFWSQAIIVEVYSLAVLMFVACLWTCLLYRRTSRPQYLYLLALLYGLGLSNHWPLLGLATPALISVLIPSTREILAQLRRPRFLVISIVCLFLGLAPYLSLFQSAPPFALYGSVESIDEFARYLSRSAYNDQSLIATWLDKRDYQVWILGQSLKEFGYVGILLVLTGFVISFRRLKPALSIGLLLLYLAPTSVLILMLGFEFSELRQAIFRPYPVIGYISVAIWFGLGAVAVLQWLNRIGLGVKYNVGVFAAIALSVLISNYTLNDRRDSTFAEQYAHKILEATPRNAVLFVEGDVGVGLIGYLHHVAGLREDVELRSWNNLVFANRLASPFAADDIQQNHRDRLADGVSQPVFTTVQHDWPSINHGIVYERSEQAAFDCDTAMHTYIGYLIGLDEGGYLGDGHERELLFALLLDFTRQHVGLVLGSTSPGSAEVEMLARLQTTFAGKLATLERMMRVKQGESGKKVLQSIAEAAELELPEHASRQVIAVLREYQGRIELLPPANYKAAVTRFEHSLEIYPITSNTSICPLQLSYQRLAKTRQARALETRFPDRQCGH